MKVNTHDGRGAVVGTVDVADDPALIAEQSIAAQLEQALAGLRTIRDTTGTLTGANLSNAVRALARVCIVMVRLHLRRFDGED